LLRFARNDSALADVILEEHSDEESRSMQEASVYSKNEILHFVQHGRFLHTVIPSLLHGSPEMT